MKVTSLLKLAALKSGLSQDELAKRLGVTPGYLSQSKKNESISSRVEAGLRDIAEIGERNPITVEFAGGSVSKSDVADKVVRVLFRDGIDLIGGDRSAKSIFSKEELTGLIIKASADLKLGMVIDDFIKIDSFYKKEITRSEAGEKFNLLKAWMEELAKVAIFYAENISVLNDHAMDGKENIELIRKLLPPIAVIKKSTLSSKSVINIHNFQNGYFIWNTATLCVDKLVKSCQKCGINLNKDLNRLLDRISLEEDIEGSEEKEIKVHPDVFMNESLVGNRVINKKLNAILEAMNIEVDEVDMLSGLQESIVKEVKGGQERDNNCSGKELIDLRLRYEKLKIRKGREYLKGNTIKEPNDESCFLSIKNDMAWSLSYSGAFKDDSDIEYFSTKIQELDEFKKRMDKSLLVLKGITDELMGVFNQEVEEALSWYLSNEWDEEEHTKWRLCMPLGDDVISDGFKIQLALNKALIEKKEDVINRMIGELIERKGFVYLRQILQMDDYKDKEHIIEIMIENLNEDDDSFELAEAVFWSARNMELNKAIDEEVSYMYGESARMGSINGLTKLMDLKNREDMLEKEKIIIMDANFLRLEWFSVVSLEWLNMEVDSEIEGAVREYGGRLGI